MFSLLPALNDNLGGNNLYYNESEDAYYIQHGADSVPKKLGNGGKITYDIKTTVGSNNYTTTFEKPNNANSVFLIFSGAANITNYSNLICTNGNMSFIGRVSGACFYVITDLTDDFTITYNVAGTGTNTFYIIYSE